MNSFEKRFYALCVIIGLLVSGGLYVYSQTPPGPNTIQHGEGINYPTVTATDGYFYGATNITDRLFGDFGALDITTTGDISGSASQFNEYWINGLNRSDALQYPVSTASYIIWTDGAGNYYAKNGTTGEIEFSGTVARTVMQATMNSVNAMGGGMVFITAGGYPLSGSVEVYSNTHIMGSGYSSHIIGPTVNMDVFSMGEYGPVSNIIIENLRITNAGIHNTNQAIDGDDVTDCIFRNNQIEVTGAGMGIALHSNLPNIASGNIISGNIINAGESRGIYVPAGSQRNIVENNYVFNGSMYGIQLEGEDNRLVNNVVDDCTIAMYLGGTRNVIKGNIGRNSESGIRTTSDFVSNIIENNVLQGNTQGGIRLGTGAHSNIISENLCIDNGQNGILLWTNSYNIITDNVIKGSQQHGISIREASTHNLVERNMILDNNVANLSYDGIYLQDSSYNTISHNKIYNTNALLGHRYAINLSNAPVSYTLVHSNLLEQGGRTGVINNAGTNTKIYQNEGYIAPGEERTVSGTLTAGNANAICFSWNNPEAQDILIKKVVVEVTTAGGTAGSHLDVGIADDAAGTNRGTEFFNDLLLNTVAINDSWLAGDGGTQTKWVFCQDIASAVDDWVVGQILDANAASLVGRYYIVYAGR